MKSLINFKKNVTITNTALHKHAPAYRHREFRVMIKHATCQKCVHCH